MTPPEIISIAKYDYPKSWGIRGHFHDFFQVFYVLSGTGTMVVGDVTYQVTEGHWLFIKPGAYHALLKMTSGNLRIIDVKFTVPEPQIQGSLMELPAYAVCSAKVERLLEWTLEEWRADTRYGRGIAALLLQSALYLAFDQDCTQPRGGAEHLDSARYTGATRCIAEYVERNYTAGFSLEEMALELHYYRTYLCKVFKKNSGLSIMDYLYQVRIRHAVELMDLTDYKLEQISEKIGFKNVHHFSRIFKQVTGLTPSSVQVQTQQGLYSELVSKKEFLYRYQGSEK